MRILNGNLAANSAISPEPLFSTCIYEIWVCHRKARVIAQNAIYKTHWTSKSPTFYTRLIQPLQQFFFLRIKLVTTVKTRTNATLFDVMLIIESCIMSSLDKLGRILAFHPNHLLDQTICLNVSSETSRT